MIRVLPTWKRKQKYDKDGDDDDDDDDDDNNNNNNNNNNNKEEYRGIRRKMDNSYCMKTKKKTRKLDNVWTVDVDDKDLCILAFRENMTKMT